MAKKVRFSGSTSFNFGANASKPKKSGKRKGGRKSSTGGGS